MSLYVDIRKKLGDFTLETKFEVQDGVTGILGASGCGKSMTLRCIAGIMKPDEGHIELNGKVLFDSSMKINVRPQDRLSLIHISPKGRLGPMSISRKYPTTVGGSTSGNVSTTSNTPFTAGGSFAI